MKKKDQIAFRLESIELLEASLVTPVQPLPLNNTFRFDIDLEHHLSVEKENAGVVCRVRVYGESKEYSFGNLKTVCVYKIEKLSSYFDEKQQKYNLPETVFTALNSISLSTTRGIMFSTFKGTILHNAVLPLVDPKSFTVRKV